MGKAVFNVSNCGGALSDIGGCDLKRLFSVDGLVDVRASRADNNVPLLVRSDQPDVLEVKDAGGGLYTLLAHLDGQVVLTAYNSSGDVDHLTITTADIAQMAYNTVSMGFGSFLLQPNGDIDGYFTLANGVTNFTLLFLQIDEGAHPMIGRDTFSYQLSPGLNFQSGKESPHALQFDLVRPQPGNYQLLIRAKAGPARFKMQITAN